MHIPPQKTERPVRRALERADREPHGVVSGQSRPITITTWRHTTRDDATIHNNNNII